MAMQARMTAMALGAAVLLGFGMAGEAAAQRQDCPVRLGGVLSLTGSMASVGRNIGDTAIMAVDHINQAGGIHGCPIEFLLRDDQNQPAVGVDAAKSLVDVSGVPALIGSISSGVTLPILTTVAVPSRVTMVTCCSTSPTFTTMAQQGLTQGYWFRPIPTLVVQAVTTARIAMDRNWRRVVVVYVNTDFGTSLLREFTRVMERMGGQVTAGVPFNENQPSYRAEVTRALAAGGDAMFLVGFPQDSTIVAREWLANGGTQNLLLNNALRADEFVRNVGARFLNNAWGFDYAQAQGPSVDAFNLAFQQRFNRPPNGPGLHGVYDAVVLTALAMQASPAPVTGTSIRDGMRRIQDAEGSIVGPGPDGLRRGLALLREGQRIRYVGAMGRIQFDQNGDVTGPALIWRIRDGQFVDDTRIDGEEMQELLRRTQG